VLKAHYGIALAVTTGDHQLHAEDSSWTGRSTTFAWSGKAVEDGRDYIAVYNGSVAVLNPGPVPTHAQCSGAKRYFAPQDGKAPRPLRTGDYLCSDERDGSVAMVRILVIRAMPVSAEVGVGWESAGMTVAAAIMTRRADREGEVRPPHGQRHRPTPQTTSRCPTGTPRLQHRAGSSGDQHTASWRRRRSDCCREGRAHQPLVGR